MNKYGLGVVILLLFLVPLSVGVLEANDPGTINRTRSSSPPPASTPSPSQSSSLSVGPSSLSQPRTPEEEYKLTVLVETKGFLADERINAIPADAMLHELHPAICTDVLVAYGIGIGLSEVKRKYADTLQIMFKADEEMAANMADGLVDGAIAWGCETADTSSEQLSAGHIGILMAADPSARINLRSEPRTDIPTNRYGLVGDRVFIQERTTGQDGHMWYKVQFQESKAVGWIRSDFITEAN